MASNKKRGDVICAAFNCYSRVYNCDLSFFTFTKDPERFVEQVFIIHLVYYSVSGR